MNFTRPLAFACTALACVTAFAQVNSAKPAPEQVPAKSLPVPTDVSPELQKLIAAPRNPNWNNLMKTGAEWRAFANKQAAETMQTLPAMRQRLHVTVKPTTINGVHAFVVTPDVIAPEHRDQTLIHVHGGCYELFPGESGTAEAILMAGLGHYRVISVDYRMAPDAYFPASLDDAMTVYQAELKDTEKSRKGWMDKCHMEQNHVGSLQTRLHEMQEASKREREDNENMAKLIKRMWTIMDILMSVINLNLREKP